MKKLTIISLFIFIMPLLAFSQTKEETIDWLNEKMQRVWEHPASLTIDESGYAVIKLIGEGYEMSFNIQQVNFNVEEQEDGDIMLRFYCEGDSDCIMRHWDKSGDRSDYNKGNDVAIYTILSVKEGKKIVEGFKHLKSLYPEQEDLFDGN